MKVDKFETSLQNHVDLIRNKYGENWRAYPHCQVSVIWKSVIFEPQNVKEVVPDMYHLCQEYRRKGTIFGLEVPKNIYAIVFYTTDPSIKKFDFIRPR